MFKVGDKIGPYKLVRPLGRGSFGEVWLAKKTTRVTTQYALKLPTTRVIDLPSLQREATLWSMVNGHVNIVTVHDADIHNGQLYIASDYVAGGTLQEWLRSRPAFRSNFGDVTNLITAVLDGVSHIHGFGVIHRDLKPKNILMHGPIPRICDFGMSRVVNDLNASQTAGGTPVFMSPEAHDGERLVSCDLWAVGVILYEIVTGRLPFYDDDSQKLVRKIRSGKYDPLPAAVPPEIVAAVRGALAVDAAERHADAEAMIAVLRGRPAAAAVVPPRPKVAPVSDDLILNDLLGALVRELDHPDVANRVKAAERIGALERDADALVPRLAALLPSDPSELVRNAVENALHRINTPAARAALSPRTP